MNCRHTGDGRRFQSGFSLLEILVAFSILAITLGVLLQIFSKGIHLASASENYGRAVLLAESILDTVGRTREIEIGQSSGVIDDIYEWSIDIRLFVDGEPDSELRDRQFSLYQVQVLVSWENREVVLNTLRFGPPA